MVITPQETVVLFLNVVVGSPRLCWWTHIGTGCVSQRKETFSVVVVVVVIGEIVKNSTSLSSHPEDRCHDCSSPYNSTGVCPTSFFKFTNCYSEFRCELFWICLTWSCPWSSLPMLWLPRNQLSPHFYASEMCSHNY